MKTYLKEKLIRLNTTYLTLTQGLNLELKQSLQKVWIQKTLRLLDVKSHIIILLNKYGRSIRKIIPTILMVLVSSIPYTDFFLNFFINTDEIVVGHRFPNLAAMIWSYSVCISPLLILYVSKFEPHWMSYIIPIYVYVSMFLGFFLLDINLNIESDYVFRLVALGLSLVLLILTKYLHRYFKVLILDDKVEFEINNLQKQNNDKGTA